MYDCVARGRKNTPNRVGERNGRHKFTEEQVREIRRRAATGETNSALGRELGVSETAIRYIVLRRNWPHVS
jgi:hypothetical protein